jgi:prolyl-tRNA editing enzyme YbaK/EbsC (Cys-tRNA(Pro) deacylase)
VGDIVSDNVTERLLALLREGKAEFEVMTHEPVRTSEEAARVRGTPLEQGAKALVCRADDRTILLVVPAHRRVDSRAFKRAFGVKNLQMISAVDLQALTGLEVGAVPPFGSLLGLQTYLDEGLLPQPRIAFNAGSRSTSVILATQDYMRLEIPILGRFVSEE